MSGSLLLHVCCGPCAIVPLLGLLEEGFAITAWFMNPNIQPLAEYLRRREAASQVAEKFAIPILYDDDSWDLAAWLKMQLPTLSTPDRCHACCGQRLRAARDKARQLGFEAFSTSLLYSRYQPHDFIRDEGQALSRGGAPDFIYRDFRSGWQKGIDLSIAWGLYRQPYCGCVFSEAERYAKKLARLRKNAAGKNI